MNTDTLDKLRKLKFYGMFHAFKSSLESGKTNDYTPDELLAHLVDAEWDDRNNRRVERQILSARFRYWIFLSILRHGSCEMTPVIPAQTTPVFW